MNKKKLLILTISLGLIGLGTIGIINYQKYNNPNNFPKNMTINGILVAGKPVDQSYKLLLEQGVHGNVRIYTNKSDNKPKYVIKNAKNKYYKLNDKELTTILKNSRKPGAKRAVTLPTDNQAYFNYLNKTIRDFNVNNSAISGKKSHMINGETQFEVTKETYPTKVNVKKLINSIYKDSSKHFNVNNNYYLSNYYSGFKDKNYLGHNKLQKIVDKANEHVNEITLNKTKLSPEMKFTKEDTMKMSSIQYNRFTANQTRINKWVIKNFKQYSDLKNYGNKIKSPDGHSLKFDKGNHGKTIDYTDLSRQIATSLNTRDSKSLTPKLITVDNKKPVDYVGVNLNTLHEYVVRDGKVKVSTGVMSGKPGSNHTPTGYYKIDYKMRNTSLKGFNDDGSPYDSPVSYWEPFNGSIGLHDSPWQPSTVYGQPSMRGNYGSHGCINNPPSVMGKVYSNTYTGMRVIVY